jgi:hypothetical protein
VTEWPKNPDLHYAAGSALEPVGPLNVFNEKLAAANAINDAIATKTQYDTDHPAELRPGPLVVVEHRTYPIGKPISPGMPAHRDESKFMIDVPPNRMLRRR